MHIAVRSSITTGVALIGASAIALTPIQPVTSPLFNVPAAVSTASVDLTATYNPLAAWVNLFTTTADNAGQIGTAWLADPFPAGRQLGTNLIGYGNTLATAAGGFVNGLYTYIADTVPTSLTKAFQELAAGSPTDAATTINQLIGLALFTVGLPLFPLLDLPKDIAANFVAVVNTAFGLETVLPLVVGLLGPFQGSIQAFGENLQVVVDAIGAGDTGAAVGAMLDIVPNVINAFINGGTFSSSSFAGLLTPEAGGLLYSLAVTIPKAIATALGAPTATPPAASKRAASASEAQGPAASPKVSGTAHSKRASAAVEVTDSNVEAKDGNKAEPETVVAPSAASSSQKAVAAKSSAPKSTADSTGSKGRSARR